MNEKGFSIIELLICFVLVSIISVSMFQVVLEYQDRQQVEQTKAKILTYKNTLTKKIMDKVIHKGVWSASTSPLNSNIIILSLCQSLDCYESDYVGETVKLEIDKNNANPSIKYYDSDYLPGVKPNEVYELPDGFIIGDGPYLSFDNRDENNKLLLINIPIENENSDFNNEDYSIKIIAPYGNWTHVLR